MKATITTLATAAAIAAAIGLTGCTSTPTPAPTKADLTPTITVTPTVTPGDQDGDGKISAWEQEQIDKTKTKYTLSTGETVKIDPNKTLPPAVIKDISTKVTKQVGKQPDQRKNFDESSDWQFKLYDKLEQQEKLTGKSMIPVTYGFDGRAMAYLWCVGDPAGLGCHWNSSAAAVQAANKWVADRANRFAVVVID